MIILQIGLSDTLNAIILILIAVLLVLVYRRIVSPKDEQKNTQKVKFSGGVKYSVEFEDHVISLLDERHSLKEQESRIRQEHSSGKIGPRQASLSLKPILARLSQIDLELKSSGIL